MLSTDINSTVQALATIGLALLLVIIGYRKITKDWKADSAESGIITIMHKELDRMSAQNTALSTEIGKLHQQIIELNNQLSNLSIENQRLQAEVIALTEEVSKFKASMAMKGAA